MLGPGQVVQAVVGSLHIVRVDGAMAVTGLGVYARVDHDRDAECTGNGHEHDLITPGS